MDGTAVNEVATPSRSKSSDSANAEPIDLLLHKQQLINAARSIDPLKPLRRHPVLTVAAAAVLGVVAASPAAARTVHSATKSTVMRQLALLAKSNMAQLMMLGRVAMEAARRGERGGASSGAKVQSEGQSSQEASPVVSAVEGEP